MIDARLAMQIALAEESPRHRELRATNTPRGDAAANRLVLSAAAKLRGHSMNTDERWYRDMLCYEAMGTLRAMAWHRPEDLTDHALRVVRDFDHSLALDELPASIVIDGLRQMAKERTPYPEFCGTPDKCAGLSYCPRDPTCAD